MFKRIVNGLELLALAGAVAFVVLLFGNEPGSNGSATARTPGARVFVANCARCHNLEKAGENPYAPAPPFRDIAKMYKATDLEEALVEGIVVGHPAMPEFEMTGEQAAAVATFIDSLAK